MKDDYPQEFNGDNGFDAPRVNPKKLDPVEQAEMKRESEQLVKDYLYTLKNQFYADDEKRFYQDRRFLIRVITLPARALWKKGVMLDDTFCRKILNEVITGIKRHSQARDYTSFSGYLLVCMQRHLKHHEEEYIAKGKDIRDGRAAKTAKGVLAAVLARAETPEQFTQALTDLSHLVTAKKATKKPAPKPAAPTPSDDQLPLF